MEEKQRVGFLRMLLTGGYFRITFMLLLGALECSLDIPLPIELLLIQVLQTSLIFVLSFCLA